MDENKNKNSNKLPKNTQTIIILVISGLLMLTLVSFMNSWIKSSTTKYISYTEFVSKMEAGEIDAVRVESDRIVIVPKKQVSPMLEFTYYTGFGVDRTTLYEACAKNGVQFDVPVQDSGSAILDFLLIWVLPIVLMYAVLGFFVRRMTRGGGGMMGVGKSTAKVYVEKSTGVTFKDVAGQDEAKESLTEIVDFLHNPGKYVKIGAKLPKGALLVGPPGTGKTLLAKAVAGEAKVPFFSLAGSDFVEMFVGVGASRVRDLFKQAQQMAPCIIFIDEIDAIGKTRDTRYGGNDEREQTLNQLLSEMDGFDTSKGLLILAATNRPEVLDKALLRPGRFDRRIIVDKPDLKGRLETLKVHSKNVLMDDSVDLEEIALATSGAVGSDLANMINEAAILAVKQGRNVVSQADLFESVEVVIAGKEKKDRILGEKEKRTVAYHEVGHALVTALQKDAEPVQKITIVPRTMGSLGYVMQVPEEEKYMMTKDELEARLVTLLAGRAAEELVFDTVTTGASNDIEKATQIARAMVTQYGMSEKFGLMSLENIENRYLDGNAVLNCGDATAAEIDQEVMKLLKTAFDKSKKLLSQNREILDRIAEFLFEKETITGKEFMDIFHKVQKEKKGVKQLKNNEINIRDPFVLVYEGKYYMYGTRAETCWGKATGFDCYVGTNLEDWEGPYEVFHKPEDFWADKNCWAPEVHFYKGAFYMFATFKGEEIIGGTQILKAESPLGPFVEHSIRQITPKDWECIDGTFYVSPEGKPYMVFVHEWVQIQDGTICAVELSADLTHAVGEPFQLFAASEAEEWVVAHENPNRPGKNYVTDGPFLYRTKSGRLILLWSSFGAEGYTEALAYSDNGDITGKWIQDNRLLFSKDGGHGMLFTGLDGKLYLTLHSPNKKLEEHPAFYHIREENNTLYVN